MVESNDELREKCIEFFIESCKLNGLNDIAAKIIGILHMELEEISLEELTEKSGYSISAISTAVKPLIDKGFIKRIKKPGSKKLYFYMKKDMIGHSLQMMTRKYNMILVRGKEQIPLLIRECKDNSKANSKEIKILEDYLMQITEFEEGMLKMMDMLNTIQQKIKDMREF